MQMRSPMEKTFHTHIFEYTLKCKTIWNEPATHVHSKYSFLVQLYAEISYTHAAKGSWSTTWDREMNLRQNNNKISIVNAVAFITKLSKQSGYYHLLDPKLILNSYLQSVIYSMGLQIDIEDAAPNSSINNHACFTSPPPTCIFEKSLQSWWRWLIGGKTSTKLIYWSIAYSIFEFGSQWRFYRKFKCARSIDVLWLRGTFATAEKMILIVSYLI